MTENNVIISNDMFKIRKAGIGSFSPTYNLDLTDGEDPDGERNKTVRFTQCSSASLSMTMSSLFFCIKEANQKRLNIRGQQESFQYQVDSSVGLDSDKCQVECEDGSAGDCLHCLRLVPVMFMYAVSNNFRYIDARVLSPPQPSQDNEDEGISTTIMVSPVVWSSAFRYPPLPAAHARILLQKLEVFFEKISIK